MPFPARLLRARESVVVELHPHWSVLVRPAGVAVVVTGGAAWLLFAFPGMLLVFAGLLGAAIALSTGWLALRWMQRATTIFAVTTERVALRGGVVVKKGWDIRLEKINDIAFDQNLIERLFGVGDLWVDTGGEAGMKGMARMPHPDAVRSLIFDQQGALRNSPPAGFPEPATAGRTAASAGLSVAEQLEKLDSLRQRGVITDEEFAAEKSRLIGL